MNTILLDADIWLWRACSIATTSVEFDDVAHWNVNMKAAESWFRAELDRLRKRLDAKTVIMAMGDRSQNFRKDLYPTYKKKRTQPRPPGFLEFEARIRKRCKVVQEDRLEGDDILGLLATKEPTEGKIIVSIDKDLRQIPGQLYNPDHDELETITPEAGDYWHLFQTLTGDQTDGYPGCPGVGPKTAAKILASEPDLQPRWWLVSRAFEKKGQPEAAALVQARLARILRQGDYDRQTKEIRLWTP